MNINKFSKMKDSQYKIVFEDNTSIVVHEDLILKYELLIKRYMDDATREEIQQENLNYIAYSLAIKYIAVKMRSILEIREYLEKKGVNVEIINQCIKLLLDSGYLNDEDYAKAYVADKINLSMDGPYKIVRELEKKGVGEVSIKNAIISFDEEEQFRRCDKLMDKMIRTNRNKSDIMLKKKIVDYLNNLGYDNSVINAVVSKMTVVNNDDICKKEYEKIYKRLSKKYSGKELEYKVEQKMYALGFRNIEY